MAMVIDWHAHHTAPEIADKIKEQTGKRPHIDSFDSREMGNRVKKMDAVELDVQLICQGAGVYADQLPADQALDIVRRSNEILAERITPYRDRLIGVAALSLKNIEASAKEIERAAARGFRAVLLYPHVDGEMVVDLPAMDPIFAKISELNLPIFLHGAGIAYGPSLSRLEDGGAGVAYAVISDGEVAECCLRMIAGGVLPLLLHRFFWKHKGPHGERRYSESFLEHFLIDSASSDARTLSFLVDTMGEERIVFGSDYCGGLGPLNKCFDALAAQADPEHVKSFMEKNSRRLLDL